MMAPDCYDYSTSTATGGAYLNTTGWCLGYVPSARGRTVRLCRMPEWLRTTRAGWIRWRGPGTLPEPHPQEVIKPPENRIAAGPVDMAAAQRHFLAATL